MTDRGLENPFRELSKQGTLFEKRGVIFEITLDQGKKNEKVVLDKNYIRAIHSS